MKASTLHWLIIDVGIRRPHQYWQWPSWVALAKADLARLSVLLQGNENPVLPTSQRLRDAFTKATSLAKAPGSTLDSELRLSISLVLLELLHTLEAENRDLDESLVAPRRGVRTFLADLPAMLHRPWTVPLMARACSMGTTQFTALCKDITNKTPVQHLNELRVRRARDLLAHTHDPINDIAVACGFDSAQYFATKFRAATGQSPSDFRRSHKGPSVGGDTISPV